MISTMRPDLHRDAPNDEHPRILRLRSRTKFLNGKSSLYTCILWSLIAISKRIGPHRASVPGAHVIFLRPGSIADILKDARAKSHEF
jgi:hypothetical protein